MAIALADPPTVVEELERKTLEEVERLTHLHGIHAITDEEFRIAIQAVFQVSSGLVGKDMMRFIEQAARCVKPAIEWPDKGRVVERQVYAHSERSSLVVIERHEDALAVTGHFHVKGQWSRRNTIARFRDDEAPIKRTYDAMNSYIERISKSGMTKL